MMKKPSFAVKEKKEKKEKKDKKEKTSDEASKANSQFGKDLEELAQLQGESLPTVVQDAIAWLEKFGIGLAFIC
jgi:hypothetical protein